jgi:hypothetical protein
MTNKLSQGSYAVEACGFSDRVDRPADMEVTAPGVSSLWVPVTKAKVGACK